MKKKVNKEKYILRIIFLDKNYSNFYILISGRYILQKLKNEYYFADIKLNKKRLLIKDFATLIYKYKQFTKYYKKYITIFEIYY